MVSVFKISLSELDRYRDFFQRARYKSYFQFSGISEEELTEFFFKEVEGIKEERFGFLLAMDGSVPVAFLSFQSLSWDTDHFGIPMGKIRHILGTGSGEYDLRVKTLLVKRALLEFQKMRIRHISVRVPCDDFNSIFALQRNGFFLVDSHSEWYFDYRTTPVPQLESLAQLRLCKKDDLKDVKRVIKGMFRNYFGRFHNDPYLDKKKADKLYERWIVNSCKGMADDVILAYIDGELVGVLALEIPEVINKVFPLKFGVTTIGGVSAKARGKGVFSSLVNYAQEYFKGKVDIIVYPTQANNITGLRIYEKLGFVPGYLFYTFHYYRDRRLQ